MFFVNRLHSVVGINSTINPLVFIFIQFLIVDKDRLHFKLEILFNEIQDLQIKKYFNLDLCECEKMLRRQFFKLRCSQYENTPAQSYMFSIFSKVSLAPEN